MAKIENFPTTVPFAGFYCSIHDEELDRALEQIFADRETGCDVNSDLVDLARDAIDWQAVHEAYALEYVKSLGADYDLNLTFDGMSSPKYYNFETDRIFATIDRETLARMLRAVPRKALRKRIRERFASRDGFISHYPRDLSDWPRQLCDWDHNQVGTLLELYLDREAAGCGSDGFDSYRQYELMEYAMGNGKLEAWLFKHARRGYDGYLSRLCRVHDYLQDRAARPIKTLEHWHAARRMENRPYNATPLGAWAC